MNKVLPSIVLLALLLAACDQPKFRESAAPAATATATATIKPASSQGLVKRSEMATFTLDVINRSPDPYNRPAKIKAGVPVTFSGFVLDPVAKQPGKAVDIVIDGKAYGADYGLPRQDVADYFKNPSLVKTGFTVVLPAEAIPAGSHTVTIRVVAANGPTYFDSAPINFVAQ